MFGLRNRPFRDLLLAGKPHVILLPDVRQDAIKHFHHSRHPGHAVMRADEHHPPSLCSLLVQLIELVLEQTVSMPLTWTQVKADLDPKRFTIRTVPALIRKSRAWADYCDAERPLQPAIKLLGKARLAA
jgi:hypothetical protein